MSVEDELGTELTTAMKAGEKAKVSAIRQVRAEVAVTRSSPGFEGEVDDDLYLETIAAVVRRDEKSRREYAALGDKGVRQVEELTYEIDYLSGWLPAVVGEDETRRIVSETIASLGIDDPKMAGRVIGQIMKSNEDLDGALVNRLVREELGN